MKWPLFWVNPSPWVIEKVSAHDFRSGRKCSAGDGRSCATSLTLRRFREPDLKKELQFSSLDEREAAYAKLERCDLCGAPVDAAWSNSSSLAHLWERQQGDVLDLRAHAHEFGIGACWRAPWLECLAHGEHSLWRWENWPEGYAPLEIQTPSGGWNPESRAGNCTIKGDRLHRCWVLDYGPDGMPVAAHKRGRTCGAGAGSIQTGSWHGWLEGSFLKDNLGE